MTRQKNRGKLRFLDRETKIYDEKRTGMRILFHTQRTVKLFMVWAIGLGVLFGSLPAGSAQVRRACECMCRYAGAGGEATSEKVTFSSIHSCSVDDGQTWDCKDTAGTSHKGILAACKDTAFPHGRPMNVSPAGSGGVRPPRTSAEPTGR